MSKLETSEQAYDQARDPGEEIHEEEAGGATTNTEKMVHMTLHRASYL